MQSAFLSDTVMATTTELITTPQQRQRQRQEQQQQQRSRSSTKAGVMSGFHSRDPIDIHAQILEVVARQDLMLVHQIRKNNNEFRNGSRNKNIRINKDGVISVDYVKRLAHMPIKVMYPYIERLVRYGMMEIQSLTIKRNSVKKIPVITDKGRAFLQCYNEIKSMLSALFGGG